MARKAALITGVSGQDGSYLAELLLEKRYRVFGMIRRSSRPELGRVEHLLERLEIVEGDLTDQSSLDRVIESVRPAEVYNLAAQSYVPTAWSQPVLTGDVTGVAAARLLEAIRKLHRKARFFQAASSEVFGEAKRWPQNEATPFAPRNPYGVAKVYAHWAAVNYREAHGLFACSGIMYNHESPRRGADFVSRKITRAAARIKLGLQKELKMGSLDARRDWGYSGDYVDAMWRMLQRDRPGDYVIATGKLNTLRDMMKIAFETVGLDWRDHYVFDKRFARPPEAFRLVGDIRKATRDLGWKPRVDFRGLVEMMVKEDLKAAQREAALG